MPTYTITTNLTEDELGIVGKAIFNHWVRFALGKEALGGKVIEHPSGNYAASITMLQTPGSIVIGTNSDEASIIEFGHPVIDMLAHLKPQTTYPIKIPGKATIFARTPSEPSKRKSLNTTGTGPGWMIPAMAPYSPAKILADLYQQAFGAK